MDVCVVFLSMGDGHSELLSLPSFVSHPPLFRLPPLRPVLVVLSAMLALVV